MSMEPVPEEDRQIWEVISSEYARAYNPTAIVDKYYFSHKWLTRRRHKTSNCGKHPRDVVTKISN